MEDKSQFAGFWRRFAAHCLDAIILSIGMMIVLMPISIGVHMLLGMLHVDAQAARMVSGLLVGLLGFPLYISYFALFESSARQATPGKSAMGLVVTNENGGRIGIGRGYGRTCAKAISGLCFNLGYIICGFTARRQCVHDFVASTLVIKKDAPLRLSEASF